MRCGRGLRRRYLPGRRRPALGAAQGAHTHFFWPGRGVLRHHQFPRLPRRNQLVQCLYHGRRPLPLPGRAVRLRCGGRGLRARPRHFLHRPCHWHGRCHHGPVRAGGRAAAARLGRGHCRGHAAVRRPRAPPLLLARGGQWLPGHGTWLGLHARGGAVQWRLRLHHQGAPALASGAGHCGRQSVLWRAGHAAGRAAAPLGAGRWRD